MTSSCSALSAMEAQTIAQYIHTFVDLVDNMPNEMSRHLTQLHQLNNNYLLLINKMDVYVNKFNASNTAINDKIRIGKRIESILIQMQELADEKLRYAQNIVDVTESKGKQLDADYDEVLYVNHLIDNSSDNYNNSRNNAKISTNGGKNSVISNGLTNFDEESGKHGMNSVNGINESNESKQSDKRLLPRRACALKSGDTSEPYVTQKLPKKAQKNCQRKYSSKSANFQLAMTKIYRDMALRRAKLPIKKQKSVSLSYKRNTNRKSVPKYKNRSIVRSLSAKNVKSSNVEQYIRNETKANSTKKSLSSSSSTLSQSSVSSTMSSTISSLVSPTKRNNNKSVKTSSAQSGVNRDKKRSTNNVQSINNSSSNNNGSKSSSKKGKIQNDDTSYGMFVGEPIDPNEPRYCLCDQVSYGEMICCDNQSCSIEWFHFNCVELEHKPKGKWFCPNCRGDRSNVPKK